MTYQEAFERIEQKICREKPEKICENDCMNCEFSMAFYAMDKRAPEKPTDIAVIGDGGSHKFGKCPVCERIVGSGSMFCDFCGKALAWGDEE